MTDRPIIFSASMVRALLDGRKTQTRRVFSHKWPVLGSSWAGSRSARAWDGFGWQWAEARNGDGEACIRLPWEHPDDGPPEPDESAWYRIRPPYETGDRLWVKETYQLEPSGLGPVAVHYAANAGTQVVDLTGDTELVAQADRLWTEPDVSRPSIHMPRWASRLTLTVTEVRVQPLWDITPTDAVAEGVQPQVMLSRMEGGGVSRWGYDGLSGMGETTAKAAYRILWNSLHGPGAWDANPWVVAISFTVQRGNIDAGKP